MRFLRFLGKNSLALELGVGPVAILTQVVAVEDITGYTRPVYLSNDQLQGRCGAGSYSTLHAWRKIAVESGWLAYSEGRRRHVGTYFVTIPEDWREAFERDRHEYQTPTAKKPATEKAEKATEKTEKPKPTTAFDAAFAKFWEVYPKQINEERARRAYNRLGPDAELQKAILDAIADQKKWPTLMNEFPRYWAMPHDWLNDRRWKDKRGPTSTQESTNGTHPQPRRPSPNPAQSRKVR